MRSSTIYKQYLYQYTKRIGAWVATGLLGAALAAGATASERISFTSPLTVTAPQASGTGISLDVPLNVYQDLALLERLRLKNFVLSKDKHVDLDLERFEITTRATRIVAGTPEGDVSLTEPDIALFRGGVVGEPDSRVVVGMSPRGYTGIITLGSESYLFSPQKGAGLVGQKRPHILQRLSELNLQPSLTKGELRTDDAPDLLSAPSQIPEPQAPGTFHICRLALECDYEYWSQFSDMDSALDYIYVLFGAIGDIYERDVSTKLALTFIRIWTTSSDPYAYTGGLDTGLKEFQTYWNAHHNPGQAEYVERDLAHLLSSRGVGAYAWPGVLCNYTGGYSISGGNALLPTLAENLFHDIRYAAHEIGHNFGAKHTHCFDPPIDKCGVENNCNQTQDCSTAPSTLMSYCHNCPGAGNNISERFHSSNITLMQDHIVASCLRAALDPAYVDGQNISGIEDGTMAHPYNTVKEGTEAVYPGGTVKIQSGEYDEPITIPRPMTIDAAGGSVVIGR